MLGVRRQVESEPTAEERVFLATAFGKSRVVGGLAVMLGSVIAPRVVDLRNAFERELNGSVLQGPTRMTRASNG